MRDLYRLYIDEVGNHDMKPTLGQNERYLTLFGVIVNGETMLNTIQPDMRDIKQAYFQQDPDEPIIFHRKEISRYKGVFKSLYSDQQKRQRFGDEMLALYKKWTYTAIAVTIDKIAYQTSYSVWRYEPYHYCLEKMVERYVLFLRERKWRGDVMVEARGTKPDQKLKASYTRLFERGTSHIPPHVMQTQLTTKNLKIKNKKANVSGLQIADLLAHAAHYDNLVSYGHVQEQKSQYNVEIVKFLEGEKYNRRRDGVVDGYGRVMLP